MIEFDICVHDWKNYNYGNANWRWFKLPEQETELLDYLDEMHKQGLEPFIVDFFAPFKISEHANIEKIIEISNLSEYELLETLNPYDNELNEIHFMDDLESFIDSHFTDLYNAFTGGMGAKINWHDDYFKLNGYGHIETISSKEYERIHSRMLQKAFDNFNY